jgi:hypothetical protein
MGSAGAAMSTLRGAFAQQRRQEQASHAAGLRSSLDLLPGVAGGFTRALVAQPFDTVKVRLQVLGRGTALAATVPPDQVYTNSIDCCRKMVRFAAYMCQPFAQCYWPLLHTRWHFVHATDS